MTAACNCLQVSVENWLKVFHEEMALEVRRVASRARFLGHTSWYQVLLHTI